MQPRTKREYLKHLVAGKNAAFRPLTDEEKALGFLGWHERGYLPHCDYPDLVQFVTFRLCDSMPASRRGEWEHLLSIEDPRAKRTKLEEYLDRGNGACHLRDPSIAALVDDAFVHHHREQYELLAWVVMPNHVHLLVHVWRTPLWKLVQRWKTLIATRAGAILRLERRAPARRESNTNSRLPSGGSALRRTGTPFWEREYWDTFMRDDDQERTAIRYIEANPLKALFCLDPAACPFSSARYRDPRTRELVLPAPGVPSPRSARIENQQHRAEQGLAAPS